ncbi:16S rRNA (guanine(966)-N(2))-methyltransferase RsmD [Solemya pervernicosa gill symbiont]|uniref:Ribosomal RNA small subunit methyltransferase D n=1 Tax=Solemya pervernicosa gill symbiont TaxID=642797 RepID=A0A1T2LB69_9GAMM|nr:16S rRNA (guanine(966)-N(2))-methyltransferase RsmD [Solemya pervernicosa gill symbiont]OOZ42337.1 16S rRNA (guanine(966)-N(2))-methyltransferase RsmD [Solemya pervernicosa gill symbiont]
MGGKIRIIGGSWRGRKFPIPDVEGLRPTPDRVRETLFNWLMPVLGGARCLDLYAGSGALGLEAASRGADRVVMVDRDHGVVRQLRHNIDTLKSDRVSVVQADALAYLERVEQPFDIVFLDPPFRQELVAECCQRLESGGWLTANAHIYLELERELGEPQLPKGWSLLRSKVAGQVGYHLATRQAGE